MPGPASHSSWHSISFASWRRMNHAIGFLRWKMMNFAALFVMGNRVLRCATIRIAMAQLAARIGSLSELAALASKPSGAACFIYLRYNGRSSKHLWFRDDRFYLFSETDGTEEEAAVEDFGSLGSGFLLEAMKRGHFYRYL
jgi:hypothetical protein